MQVATAVVQTIKPAAIGQLGLDQITQFVIVMFRLPAVAMLL